MLRKAVQWIEANGDSGRRSSYRYGHETIVNDGAWRRPQNWGRDSLSEFIEWSRENEHATFVQMPGEYGVIKEVDACFQLVSENLNENTSLLASLLLQRSHSAYRAGCRLAISGQVVDSFPALRACLEAAMYAVHIDRNPDAGLVWLRRHESDQARRRCRSEFTTSAMFATWHREDPTIEAVARDLYERTIDFGAHPNERSITANTLIEETEDARSYSQLYLTRNPVHIAHAVKTCAQVGLAALCGGRLVFRQRFDLLGISDRLARLRQQL